MFDDELDLQSYFPSDLDPKRISPGRFRDLNLFGSGPNWRWKKARWIASRGRISSRVECDPIFWQLVNHFSELPRETQVALCGDRRLRVASAETIFRDPVMRLRVEARLLAMQPPSEVAARLGLEAQDIQDYCDIFFDVLDSLNASSWLAAHVFDAESEFEHELHAVVCKKAYQGGSAVCEHWLERLPFIGQACDLSTRRGREVKRLELALLQDQLQREDLTQIGMTATRIGASYSQERSGFLDASAAISCHIAHKLGELLPVGEDAHPERHIAKPGHRCEGKQVVSA